MALRKFRKLEEGSSKFSNIRQIRKKQMNDTIKQYLDAYTRSLVYKGMVYKVFFGPVLDFQKKLGF